MARKFLTSINLNGNEIQNVVVQNLASDPGSPAAGQLWYNTTDDVLRYYDGTTVIDLTSASNPNAADVPIADAADDFTATDVEGALAELQADAEADAADLAAHIGDTADAHAASAITNTPAGNLSATTLQAAVNELDSEKAPLASPGFTGNPTAPTPTAGDNDTSVATTAFVTAAIAALIDAAPGTLDTLNELANALGDDANFATTITNALATKPTKFAATIGNGTDTSIAVTHSLGTRDIVVSVHDASSFAEVECDVVKTSTTVVTLDFTTAPATNSLRVTVHG